MGIKSMTEALEEMKKVLDEKTKKEDASNDKSDDGEGIDKVDPKAAKKKFADRKDKDLDNDGDTDSSDEYLHKRRKAIGKSITDGNAFTGALTAAKKNGDTTFVVAGKKYKVEDYVKEAEGDDEEEVDTTSKKKKVKAPADKGIEDDEAEVEMNPKLSQKGNKKLEAKESAISKIREKLLGVLRTEAKQPNDSGTPAEAEDDTLPPARAKKKNDDHVAEVDDTEEKGHDDVSKAGRAGPSKKPRGNDNPQGDAKIVKAGTPVKEDTGEMAEPFVTPTQSFKKMIDAYNDVLK